MTFRFRDEKELENYRARRRQKTAVRDASASSAAAAVKKKRKVEKSADELRLERMLEREVEREVCDFLDRLGVEYTVTDATHYRPEADAGSSRPAPAGHRPRVKQSWPDVTCILPVPVPVPVPRIPGFPAPTWSSSEETGTEARVSPRLLGIALTLELKRPVGWHWRPGQRDQMFRLRALGGRSWRVNGLEDARAAFRLLGDELLHPLLWVLGGGRAVRYRLFCEEVGVPSRPVDCFLWLGDVAELIQSARGEFSDAESPAEAEAAAAAAAAAASKTSDSSITR